MFQLDSTYVLDDEDNRYYVLVFDDDYEGMGDLPGRFLVASCETGKMTYLGVEECRLEFSESAEVGPEEAEYDYEVKPTTNLSEVIDKLTSNPVAKAWVDKLVEAVSRNRHTTPWPGI